MKALSVLSNDFAILYLKIQVSISFMYLLQVIFLFSLSCECDMWEMLFSYYYIEEEGGEKEDVHLYVIPKGLWYVHQQHVQLLSLAH